MAVQPFPQTSSIQALKEATDGNGNLIFPTEDDLIDTTEHTIECQTVTQLVYAAGFENYGDTYTILLNPTGGVFAFQTDPVYREGLNQTILNHGTKNFRPKNDSGIVSIQGVQVTAANFMKIEDNISFERIWLKDCVHTKTAQSPTFMGNTMYQNVSIDSCLLSMHVRAGEYGTYFDAPAYLGAFNLSNCARYIEYSDLDDTTAPNTPLFEATTNNCSTIVRNCTLYIDGINGYESSIVGATVNSSWDMEFYKVYINLSDYTTGSPSVYNKPLGNVQNCFVVLKAKDYVCLNDVYYNDFETWVENGVIRFTNTTGVNIYDYDSHDMADSRGYKTMGCLSDPAVKFLSDSDCKLPAVLNKWGFFVNTQSGD